jgi:NPCBM/NEW2 domain
LALIMNTRWPLVLALLAAVTGPAAGQVPLVRVEASDGRVLTGALQGLRDARLIVGSPDGASAELPVADLVLLQQVLPPPPPRTPEPPLIVPPPAAPPPADDLLLLAGPSGDRLVGRIVGGDADGVRFQLAAGEPFDVSYERIARLLPSARLAVDRLLLLEGGGADDRLWRQRPDGGLDSLTGVVDRIADGHVVFEGALGRQEFPLAEVVAVVLAASGDVDAAPLPGVPITARLAGGSRVHAGLLELDATRAVLATRFAPRLELPASALLALVRRGDGRVLLADLPPVEVEERPATGGPADVLFPWRADLSVTGRLLSVDGLPRATGLGVHAVSRLLFDLPPGCRALRVTAGLCDEVRELPAVASVDFRVLVDGQPRGSARVVEGDPAGVLRVDGLSGAKRLELQVTDGGDDDAGDRAAWVDGVLLCGED